MLHTANQVEYTPHTSFVLSRNRKCFVVDSYSRINLKSRYNYPEEEEEGISYNSIWESILDTSGDTVHV